MYIKIQSNIILLHLLISYKVSSKYILQKLYFFTIDKLINIMYKL